MGAEKTSVLNERENWLDIIRVVACISVLVFHVINGYMKDSLNNSQMYWPDYMNSIWLVLKTYQVPTFFCISGYLYQKYSARKFEIISKNWFSNYGIFELKKAISLLIPYVVFSILYVLMSSGITKEMHTAYGLKSIIYIYKDPVAQYWYLLSLMWLFIFAPVFSLVFKKLVEIQWLFILIISLIFSFGFYPLSKVFPQFVYFSLGYIISKYIGKNKIKTTVQYRIIGVAIFSIMSLILIILNIKIGETSVDLLSKITILISCGMIIGLFLFFYKMDNKFTRQIVRVAKYSLHIYLIHTWITGIVRVGLKKVGIYNIFIHTILGILVGLSVSLCISIVIKKIKVMNFFFEPQLYMVKKEMREKKDE